MTRKITFWDVFLAFIWALITAHFINKWVLDEKLKALCNKCMCEVKEYMRK